jgi:hypothetical protein
LDVCFAGRALGVAIRTYATSIIVATPDAVLGRGIDWTANRFATVLDHHCQITWKSTESAGEEQMAVNTYTILLAASGIVPANRGVASSAGLGHGIIVIDIYTVALVRKTILSIRSG